MDAEFLYTQEQARAVTGIGQETLRHWRRLIPYLAAKSGKTARFSFGDFLGLSITREVTGNLGVSISHVRDGIESLFRILSEETVVHPGSVAVLRNSISFIVGGSQLSLTGGEPVVLVPLDPVIEGLQTKLLHGLKLPPQSVFPFFAEAISR
jgi:hypothetical protein